MPFLHKAKPLFSNLFFLYIYVGSPNVPCLCSLRCNVHIYMPDTKTLVSFWEKGSNGCFKRTVVIGNKAARLHPTQAEQFKERLDIEGVVGEILASHKAKADIERLFPAVVPHGIEQRHTKLVRLIGYIYSDDVRVKTNKFLAS